VTLLIELLQDKLLTLFTQFGLLAELGVRNAVVKDIVEIEAMSVQELDGVRLSNQNGTVI